MFCLEIIPYSGLYIDVRRGFLYLSHFLLSTLQTPIFSNKDVGVCIPFLSLRRFFVLHGKCFSGRD